MEKAPISLLACGSCGKRFGVKNHDPRKTYQCTACKGTLVPAQVSGPACTSDFTLASPVTLPAGAPPDSPPPTATGAPAAQPSTKADVPHAPPFGKYAIQKLLGRGGMGIVYEAVDTELNRRVALKMMLMSPYVGDKERVLEEERFLREAQLCANLPKHPHIVTVYDAGVIERKRYIAMEFINGKTMAEWRRMGSVNVRQQVQLLRDVALAVHHAHEHGVIHRDLKPGNVLVDEKNQAHVADFGLAKQPGKDAKVSGTASGVAVGTPAYMSPEQVLGRKDVDRRTDVWSLGVMLYEILTGDVPFKGETSAEVTAKVIRDDVPRPSSAVKGGGKAAIDAAIENVCMTALVKNPAERYTTAEAFAQDLTRWLEGDRVKVEAPKAPVRNKARWAYGVAAAAGLLICIGALAVWLPSRQAGPTSTAASPEGPGAKSGPVGSGPSTVDLARQAAADRRRKVAELVAQARNLESAGVLEAAVGKATEALQLDPGSQDAQDVHASLQRHIQEKQTAEEREKKYREWLDKALAYKIEKKWEEAEGAYGQALAYKETPEAKSGRAEARLAQVRSLQSAAALEGAAEKQSVALAEDPARFPRTPHLWIRRASSITDLRLSLREYEADKTWNEAVVGWAVAYASTNNPQYLVNLAYSLDSNGSEAPLITAVLGKAFDKNRTLKVTQTRFSEKTRSDREFQTLMAEEFVVAEYIFPENHRLYDESKLAIEYDGQKIWMITWSPETLWAVAPETTQVLRQFNLAPNFATPRGLSWDGQSLWVDGYNDAPSVLDTEKGTVKMELRSLSDNTRLPNGRKPNICSNKIARYRDELWGGDYQEWTGKDNDGINYYSIRRWDVKTQKELPAVFLENFSASDGIAFDGEFMWAMSEGVVTRFNPVTLKANRSIVLKDYGLSPGEGLARYKGGLFLLTTTHGYAVVDLKENLPGMRRAEAIGKQSKKFDEEVWATISSKYLSGLDDVIARLRSGQADVPSIQAGRKPDPAKKRIVQADKPKQDELPGLTAEDKRIMIIQYNAEKGDVSAMFDYSPDKLKTWISEKQNEERQHPTGNAESHYLLGFVLEYDGQRDQAIAEYRKAIKLDPKHKKAHRNLGLALEDKGEKGEAAMELREAMK